MAGVAARLLNQAKGLQPLGLISGCTRNRDDVREVLESFGVRTFLRLSRNPLTRPISLIKAMIHTTRAWWHIRQRGFGDFIEHFQVHGIHIGDMIYDSFIRYDHTYQAPHPSSARCCWMRSGLFLVRIPAQKASSTIRDYERIGVRHFRGVPDADSRVARGAHLVCQLLRIRKNVLGL